nr:MAG TPA: hypothetical protein [Caudoviricetes sp.]
MDGLAKKCCLARGLVPIEGGNFYSVHPAGGGW